MTAVQYVEYLLENNWKPDAKRVEPVPKPEFTRESAQDRRKVNLDQHDEALLRDGGLTNIEPQGWGWSEERQVSRVTVDIRTTGEAGQYPGRERLWGYRGVGGLDPNEAESYGGLVGEVKRIVDTVRKGDQEYCLIVFESANDLSGEMGGQVWRGTVDLLLDTRGNTIEPEP